MSNAPERASVEYNILLSKTYRVPVLYLQLHGLLPDGPKGLDAIYHYLVPELLAPELQRTGVMGGISMTVSFAQ